MVESSSLSRNTLSLTEEHHKQRSAVRIRYNTHSIIPRTINKWADALGYDMTPKDPEKPEDDLKNMYRTAKKKLNPGFVIDPGTQENMIHAILFMRRIEFMHLGMRWFDTRRYGITLYRRLIDQDEDTLVKVTDTMTDEGGNRDPRRCLQLPPDVIAAGLTPAPGKNDKKDFRL